MHGIEKMYQAYKDKGFVVLARPCNQFNSQEPKPNSVIEKYYKTKYNVTFPILEKGDVNGSKAPRWYDFVKTQCPESGPLVSSLSFSIFSRTCVHTTTTTTTGIQENNVELYKVLDRQERYAEVSIWNIQDKVSYG